MKWRAKNASGVQTPGAFFLSKALSFPLELLILLLIQTVSDQDQDHDREQEKIRLGGRLHHFRNRSKQVEQLRLPPAANDRESRLSGHRGSVHSGGLLPLGVEVRPDALRLGLGLLDFLDQRCGFLLGFRLRLGG
jgi:hypothetical protein